MKQFLAILLVASSSVQSYACLSTPVQLGWSEIFRETSFALDTNKVTLKTGSARDQFAFDEERRTWTYRSGGESIDLPAGYEGDVSVRGRTISRVNIGHNGRLVFKPASGNPGNALTNRCCDVVVVPLEGRRSLQMTFNKNGTQLTQVRGPSGMVKGLELSTQGDGSSQILEVSNPANQGTYQASCGKVERIETSTGYHQPNRKQMSVSGGGFQ
ncbi:MAG: hypothetical protein IPJ71_08735 [Bdellovibrionales bacterium]|nr:hypothetical protein [Bdellovibrionales bacterium]